MVTTLLVVTEPKPATGWPRSENAPGGRTSGSVTRDSSSGCFTPTVTQLCSDQGRQGEDKYPEREEAALQGMQPNHEPSYEYHGSVLNEI